MSKKFTEQEIRPPDMMADKEYCVEADRDYLLGRREEWEVVACPACDASSATITGEKRGFVYVECRECGTVYANPRPSQRLLDDFYANSLNYAYWNRHIFPATEQVRRKKIFRPRAEQVRDYCHQLNVRPGVLLEIGAGFGIFCEEMAKMGVFERIIALEPTPNLAKTCSQKNLEVIRLPVERVRESEIADVLAAFEVLEHLFAPSTFIEQCRRILRPDGLLILTCPNVSGFDVATLGTLSATFNHEHMNYFHSASLQALLKRHGFDVLDVQTPGQLDAEIVRKHVLEGTFSVGNQPFLKTVLVDRWEELGGPFQNFLNAHKLSSHMWVVCRKPGPAMESGWLKDRK